METASEILHKYIGLFGSLHRNRNPKYGYAPHKPILLLTMLNGIEKGDISRNFIPLTLELVATFRTYWRALVPENTWSEKIALPFRFMVYEGFWELVKNGVAVPVQKLGARPTLQQLTTEVDGAVLAPDLWNLLQEPSSLSVLRAHILHIYFGVGGGDAPQLPATPVDYEVERLKAEAQSKFRTGRVSESKDEAGYYVRHALFPRVVKQLYNHSCAVCSLCVHTDEGNSLIDAAHIMPFSQFHNDDPRNGIALCKNHHWGFDAGWFALSNEYKVLVSPHLQESSGYLKQGGFIRLPEETQYAPAQETLEWHRLNIYKR